MKLNPWIHHTLLGFAVFNVGIGLTLFFWYPRIPLTVVSPTIPQSAWGIVFLISGLVMLFGLFRNSLRLLRFMMILGLFVKIMWEIGLLFRIREGGALFLVELWAMIAYLQFLGVIYFSPEHHDHS